MTKYAFNIPQAREELINISIALAADQVTPMQAAEKILRIVNDHMYQKKQRDPTKPWPSS